MPLEISGFLQGAELTLLTTCGCISPKPPFYRKKSRAISWFKDTAHEHITRVRTLAEILKNHGVSVQMLKTDRVGYVVYEDEFQIVAERFAGEQY
jgi:hypothetical protein